MKKVLSFILIVCMLLSMLSGCADAETEELFQEIVSIYWEVLCDLALTEMKNMHVEIMQTWSETFEIAKEGISQKAREMVPDITYEIINTWKETFDIFDEGTNKWIVQTFNSYDSTIEHKWTPILTSYYENEKLEVLQRHDNGILGIHCTYYMVTLYEGDKCTYYYPSTFAPCETLDMFFKCYGDLATFKTVSQGKGIYPYVEDVVLLQILLEIQENNTSIDKLQSTLILKPFSKVIKSQCDAILSESFNGAVDTIVGGQDIISKLRDVQSEFSDANDIQANTKEDAGDQMNDAEDFLDDEIISDQAGLVPGTTEIVDSIQILTLLPIAYNFGANNNNIPGPVQWNNLMPVDADMLENMEFSVSETHLLGKRKDESTWCELSALSDLSTDPSSIVFQITNTYIQWRTLSKLELSLIAAQKDLHAAIKQIGYPVA